MKDKAIEKLTKEMMAADDPLITLLEEHLTSICINNKVASKLLREDKTLKQVSDKLWAMARSRKKGNGAMISDAECCQVAEEHFGITEEDKDSKATVHSAGQVIDILDFM